MTPPPAAKPHRDPAERERAALPLWLWMLLLTMLIVALLLLVGRTSFAA